MHIRGMPPARLTGGSRVRSLDSPWWDLVMSELVAVPGLVGRTLSIEEIAGMVLSYPDGRRPRARTVARRLAPILELVERGPNGSKGRGASYRVLDLPPTREPIGRDDVVDTEISSDMKWLLEQVERMTGGG